MLDHRLRPDSPESGVLMSTTRDTRVSTGAMSMAPEVSSETRKPASSRRSSSCTQRFCANGSPPVTHTSLTPKPRTRSTMASMSDHSPP